MTAAERINIGGDYSFAAIQALNGSLYIDSDSDQNGDGLISVANSSSLLSAFENLTIGNTNLSAINFVGTILTVGQELSAYASSELVFQDVTIEVVGDTTLSAQGRVLLEEGELISSGSVINLISDADNTLGETDIIELSGDLAMQVEDGSIQMTGVAAEINEDVSLVALLVTINGEPVGTPAI